MGRRNEEDEFQHRIEAEVVEVVVEQPAAEPVVLNDVPDEGIVDTVKVADYPPRPFEEARIKD